MDRSLSSDTTTRGIRVEVEPEYLPEYSKPEQNKYVFGYHIRITNVSDRWAKLISRHLLVIDANGKRQEMDGEGVIGKQPALNPGETHEYANLCPIETDWGTMEGSYCMMLENGEEFGVAIGRFYLAMPKEIPV